MSALGLFCARPALAATEPLAPLSPADAQAFRAWFCAIVDEVARRGPSPRWVHRDCAGLVRFAVREALVAHDARWRQAMGWPAHQATPPDLALPTAQALRYAQWTLPGGQRASYASALALIQENTRALGQTASAVLSGDLLFFDQGAEQHVMIWTGKRIVYHTGAEPSPEDSGLRSTRLEALRQHPDTRWRASPGNPNFAGWFRFGFLPS